MKSLIISDFIRLIENIANNYLYHGTREENALGILQSGSITASPAVGYGQASYNAQSKLPFVATTRNWQYVNGTHDTADNHIGHDVVFILDRNRVIQQYGKPILVSQSDDTRGTAYGKKNVKNQWRGMRQMDTNNNGRIDMGENPGYQEEEDVQDVNRRWFSSKAGEEFEEDIPCQRGGILLKNVMVGFWVHPASKAAKNPTLMNDPRRLDLVKGGFQKPITQAYGTQ